MKILVDKDFGSSSLWVPGKSGDWASCDHHSFDLPQELINRCDYLSEWYETYWPGSDAPEPDWKAYSAYLLGLAIDLKHHYEESAQVFVWRDKEVVEVTGSFSKMLHNVPKASA
jgi:hypothetical protein